MKTSQLDISHIWIFGLVLVTENCLEIEDVLNLYMGNLQVIKVRFCQKVLMFLSYLHTDEHFGFLNMKIWISVIFKAALASQMLPSCP